MNFFFRLGPFHLGESLEHFSQTTENYFLKMFFLGLERQKIEANTLGDSHTQERV